MKEALAVAKPFAQTTPGALDIYYIDTEGGQATLFVSPTGQTADRHRLAHRERCGQDAEDERLRRA
jgi:hypothetical protein